jgi:predicted acyltransferase (DUF342 family)
MSTFRKYGGTQNFSKDNNITTNTLVCNNLVLRNNYVGTFTIDGGLEVSADSHFGQNVDISGNLTAQNVQINSGFVFSDLSINGNLEVFQNTTIEGYLNVYDALYFGQGANSYLFGNQTQELLGLNTTDPQATLDIQGSTTNVLNVYSNQPTNRNIIAQNQNNHGIVVQTSDISSSIQFFNDTTISNTTPDAQIEYLEGGYLILDASNTQVYSQFSIVPSTDSSLGYIKNETAIIYDISSGKYLPKIYNTQTTENTGNALTLVTTDTSSITFLNIITPLQKGLEIGGGVYPNDTSRSLGTLGYNDNSGNYIPFQNMVSGSSLVKLRATTGLNTYAPRTDLYTLDINGPVHITNGQITPVIDSSFQILQTHFSNTTGISVGTPSSITSPYYQNILYTNNGGQSWNLSNINSGDLQTLSQNFNTIYTYNSTYAFLGGTSGFFYYTNNGGQSWANITIANLTTIYSIYVCASPSVSGLRVYYLTNTGLGAIITYFDVLFTNLNGNQYLPVTIFPINDSAFTQVTHINGDGTTYIYVTGINTSGKDQIARYPLNISSATYTTPNALYNYNAINVLNNIVIAVGTGSIYCSTNASTSYTWTNNTSISATLTSIYILDSLNAVAVGTNGTIIYSNNGFITWQNIPTEILNASGNATDITSYNLVDIDMIDINTLIITATITSYVNGSQLGNSREFYLYLPNLFNRQNNSVLDISGATYISGDLHVNDGGGIVSNDVSFSLINTNVQTIYFGGTATSINIGSTTGNTTIQNNLDILGNTTIQNNLDILGNATAENNLFILGKTITNDISLNGNIYINNNININTGTSGQQGTDIAIGINAGQNSQQSGSIAIGYSAGQYSQGQNSVAIGFQAGQTNQASNSIVLNAGGSALTAGNTGTFINPIRQTTINGAKLMAYDYSSTNEIIDVSSLSIDTYGNLIILGNATLQTNYIQPTGNTLAIGTGTANVINIGNIGNLSPAYSNIINIGGTYDFVNLGGNVTSTSVNNLVVNNKTITLNAGSITNYSSAGSGLLIRDNSNNTAGYFEVDLSMNGFVFKAPNINQSLVTDGSINNVVDLNVNSLKTSLNSAILMLQPSGTLHSDSSYVINVSNIDISNIFLRSSTSSTLTNQVVTTDVTVSGNIQAISFNATSDYRIKGNIQLLDNHFSVDTLRPIHYYNELAKREDIGFLAHEVQEHYPYLVSGEKDGQDYQALNYSGIIGILVKDVQECKAEIKRLKEKISQCIVK